MHRRIPQDFTRYPSIDWSNDYLVDLLDSNCFAVYYLTVLCGAVCLS